MAPMRLPASILVIDDEPTNFDVIETLLTLEPYELHYASSGQRVLERLSSFQPDLILLDVMMPDLDGIEVCRRIKASPGWQRIPIVMVTALTDKADLARAIAAGADDYITKPLSSLELRARVHSMLRIKQQQDQLQGLLTSQGHTIELLQNSLDALRGNVTRALPHELNTPLNGMLGLIELLIDSYEGMDTEEVRELLFSFKISAQRLERVTQQFLTYVQLELIASNPIRSAELKAGKYVTPTAELIRQTALKKAAGAGRERDLILNLEEATVILGESDLRMILEEVLDNAFKFSASALPVHVSAIQKLNQLCVVVTNLGRGITAEQIAHIGSFMQFDRPRYEQQGVGLGLAIVQKTLNLYGGTLNIQAPQLPDQAETILTMGLPLATPIR